MIAIILFSGGFSTSFSYQQQAAVQGERVLEGSHN